MKKLLLLLPICIISYICFTAQSYRNEKHKWNSNPHMTRIQTSGNYTPLPQNRNVTFSTEARTIKTPIGVFSITPNILVHPSFNTQSEVPITRHPTNPMIMFGSANTFGGGSNFSTGVFVTTDGGASWFGSDTIGSGFNYGDPGPAIDKDGRFIMSFILLSGNIGTSYSTNNGINWTPNIALPGSTVQGDKNFTGTDYSPSSPYYGRSYVVYTEFSGTYTNRIVGSYTSDGGATWSAIAPVSPVPSNGHFHQGADVKIGPNGEVYVVWANNLTTNALEDSLGFAKSTNGGVSWVVSRSNASNMNGIRTGTNGLFNGIRANGFPRIDVDVSGGSRNGWIYVVTSEKTVAPATDVADVILHKSSDGGNTWTASRVNQDTPGNGKYQYMTAVRVDEQGGVNVIYYDTRNTPTNDSAQIYVARSINGGETWGEILASDHKFKPKPISGLAQGYQGDYLGITSGFQKIWPYWCDDASGIYQAWTAEVTVSTFPLNSFNLNSPSSGFTLVTYANSYLPYTFTWDTSASTAVYKWVFGNPTTNPRKITFFSNTNSMTQLTGKLDSILANLGVAVGDSLVGQWDVWAFRNDVQNDSLKANNGPRTITLKRGIPPLTNFNLMSPPSGTTIITSSFNFSNINFNWSTSGPGATYKWKFGSPSISNFVRFSLTSNINGIDSSISIQNNTLDNMLASAGLNPGDSLVGEWTAYAYNGFDSAKAVQNYTMTLKRQPKGDVLVLYDSTLANGRISKDSVVANLNNLGVTYELYNKKGNVATNSITFKGYKRVMLVGDGSSVMSNAIKDSLKKYLSYGNESVKSKLIILSEDIGYHLDRFNSAYYDSAFARSTLGFQYVADRPGIGGRNITGIAINSNLSDSSYGPSSDVVRRSASIPSSQTYNLYKYTLFPDSMNAVGRVFNTYNVAVMAVDVESLRPAYTSINSLTVKRIINGLIRFVDEVPTSAGGDEPQSIPQSFALSQNYPNPFNPSTKIQFQIPSSSFVTLKIFDVSGRELSTLVSEKRDAGNYDILFNASDLASGIYFYRLNAQGENVSFNETRRMILLK